MRHSATPRCRRASTTRGDGSFCRRAGSHGRRSDADRTHRDADRVVLQLRLLFGTPALSVDVVEAIGPTDIIVGDRTGCTACHRGFAGEHTARLLARPGEPFHVPSEHNAFNGIAHTEYFVDETVTRTDTFLVAETYELQGAGHRHRHDLDLLDRAHHLRPADDHHAAHRHVRDADRRQAGRRRRLRPDRRCRLRRSGRAVGGGGRARRRSRRRAGRAPDIRPEPDGRRHHACRDDQRKPVHARRYRDQVTAEGDHRPGDDPDR